MSAPVTQKFFMNTFLLLFTDFQHLRALNNESSRKMLPPSNSNFHLFIFISTTVREGTDRKYYFGHLIYLLAGGLFWRTCWKWNLDPNAVYDREALL
jgi:hypothetical protein